jgi:tetratricopeptide (TPR) repeat protein
MQSGANTEKAFELKGNLCREYGQIEQAFFFYKRAIEVNPESHDANSGIGDIYRYQGKLKEAIEYYKKALSVKIN